MSCRDRVIDQFWRLSRVSSFNLFQTQFTEIFSMKKSRVRHRKRFASSQMWHFNDLPINVINAITTYYVRSSIRRIIESSALKGACYVFIGFKWSVLLTLNLHEFIFGCLLIIQTLDGKQLVFFLYVLRWNFLRCD